MCLAGHTVKKKATRYARAMLPREKPSLLRAGRALAALVTLVTLTLVPGCGGGLRDLARRRHAAEVSCDERAVAVREVGRRTFHAWGCDRSAVYICNRGACTLDGEVHTVYR